MLRDLILIEAAGVVTALCAWTPWAFFAWQFFAIPWWLLLHGGGLVAFVYYYLKGA